MLLSCTESTQQLPLTPACSLRSGFFGKAAPLACRPAARPAPRPAALAIECASLSPSRTWGCLAWQCCSLRSLSGVPCTVGCGHAAAVPQTCSHCMLWRGHCPCDICFGLRLCCIAPAFLSCITCGNRGLLFVGRARFRGYNTDLSKVPLFKRSPIDTGSTEVQVSCALPVRQRQELAGGCVSLPVLV